MAQYRVVRNPASHGGFEDIQVVDALAAKGTFAEQVLINVGDHAGVGVHPAGVGEQTLEQRSVASGRQGRGDPRLQHRIAVDHTTRPGIHGRQIQRMCHLADQAPRRIARQPRIGIQHDHIAHAGGRQAVSGNEAGIDRAAKQTVQLVQLAPLALPANPFALRRVPQPAPVQQQKAIAPRARRIPSVQRGDAVHRSAQHCSITG